MIKFWQTVPNLGFQSRNFLGDLAFGLLDNVTPADYARMMKKFTTKSDFVIVPGLTHSWDEMVQLFRENADAGFYQTDVPVHNSPTIGRKPRELVRGASNKLRKYSDLREEFGRFTHFVTAYQDEARALWKKGEKDLTKIADQAEDAALWRVNAYKFDYGALTPFEQKLKTTAFPFMTYTRKALPMLVEQAFSNPRYLSLANRFMQYNDGSASDAFNFANIPQYIKDMGFAVVNDSEEPGIVTSDMLGLGALNMLTARDPGTFFRKALSQLNPLAAAPIEMGTNRDLYFDRPLNQNWQEYLMNQVPMVSDIQSELGVDVPGFGGPVGFENPITARILGLGAQYRTVTNSQQEQQAEANVDAAIDSPIKAFNYSQDTYSISQRMENGQVVFVLQDKQTGQELRKATTIDPLVEFAQTLPQRDVPQVSTLRPPTYQDFMRMMVTG
jgi:hypothetical protein